MREEGGELDGAVRDKEEVTKVRVRKERWWGKVLYIVRSKRCGTR